jgi:hypothetical protein
MGRPAFDAIVLAPGDNVATLLRAMPEGSVLRIRQGAAVIELAAAEAIAMGHKIALGPIAAGAPVLKYGTPIGEARVAIAAGTHVHVHNLQSRRARRPSG